MKKAVILLLCLLVIATMFACGEEGHYNKGLEALELGQYSDALVEFEKAEDYEYAKSYASYTRGIIAFDEARYTDAVESFREAGALLDAKGRLREAEKWALYDSAIKLYNNKEYEKAKAAFEEVGDMEESEKYMIDCSYYIAQNLMTDGQYSEASKLLEELIALEYKDSKDQILLCAEGALAAEDYDTAEYVFATFGETMEDQQSILTYVAALKAYQNEDLTTAFTMLESIKDYRNVKEKLETIGLQLAEQEYQNGNYADAKTYFSKITPDAEINKKITICNFYIAEACYKDGKLNTAKKLYQDLGKNYERDGIKVSNRLETLEKYDAYVKICGQWKALSDDTYWETKQQGSARYWYWYNGYADSKGVIDVYCTINDDETVTIHGTAGFYRYTNYSSYSSNLNQTVKTVSFSSNVNRLSNGMQLHKDNTTKIVYNNGPKFKLDFSYTDNSTDVYFKYIYTSKYTYTQLVKQY